MEKHLSKWKVHVLHFVRLRLKIICKTFNEDWTKKKKHISKEIIKIQWTKQKKTPMVDEDVLHMWNLSLMATKPQSIITQHQQFLSVLRNI